MIQRFLWYLFTFYLRGGEIKNRLLKDYLYVIKFKMYVFFSTNCIKKHAKLKAQKRFNLLI